MPLDREPESTIRLWHVLRPHRRALALAGLAVVGISAADLLQPWPLKIVLDNVLAGRPLPPWLGAFLHRAFGDNTEAVLLFAVAAVMVITIVDSVSSFGQSYLMTSVGEWVGHDLRRAVYHHIERLSRTEDEPQATPTASV